MNAKLIHAIFFSQKSVIVTNYSDISKFSGFISLCTPYDVEKLDLNEIWNEDTIEAYFSVPEDYHMGKEKRKLFVFTNPSLELLKIITNHTEIKYLVVLNSDKSISESDVVKNAKNVILYSTKTGIFNPEFEGDVWDNDLIGSIQKQTTSEEISKKIDELYRMATILYLSFASGKNTEIRDIIAKFPPTLRKVMIPKLEQFIRAYYNVDIIIAGNGARIRTSQESEKATSLDKDSVSIEQEPNTKCDPNAKCDPDAKCGPNSPLRKKTSKKLNGKPSVVQDEIDYSLAQEYGETNQESIMSEKAPNTNLSPENDALDPLLLEQKQDLLSCVQKNNETMDGKIDPPIPIKQEYITKKNEQTVPLIIKQNSPKLPELHPPPVTEEKKNNSSLKNSNLYSSGLDNSNSNNSGLDNSNLNNSNPNNSGLDNSNPNDGKYMQFKNEFDRLTRIDKNIYRCFCQVLYDYRSSITSNNYCEEIVNPKQIYIELRSTVWSSNVPIQFSNKWFYLHFLNLLKSKPFNVEIEFKDLQNIMLTTLSSLNFIEKPDFSVIFNKVKNRLQKGDIEKQLQVPPPNPHQEIVDSIRLVKQIIAGDEIEDFKTYSHALKRILEFISE